MSKKKRKEKGGGKRFTPIEKHKRKGSKLSTLLADLNMKLVEWERDLMPEHLWIELLAWEYKDLSWFKIYNDFMDRIDAVLEKERKTPILGFITDFGTLTESERQKFLTDNRDFIYFSFFKPIGKILSLYPENPANWMLLDDWKSKEQIDFESELNKLAMSLSRLIKAKDLYTGHLRAIPLNRLFKHNKLYISNELHGLGELLSKYSINCSESEKYRVQQFARTTMNSIFMKEERYQTQEWSRYFWNHNYNIVPCLPVEGSLRTGDITNDADIKKLQEQMWQNCILLMKYVDKIGLQYKYNLYNPLTDEIQLGLFSRIVRLYISFISNPFLWTRDLAGIMLRCIGESAIILFYLVKKGSEAEFREFQSYSLGKEKLLMLHMQDILEEQTSLDGESIVDISNGLGGEFISEMQPIELKGWTRKNIRELAQETDLENIYRWVIDPSSAEIHGSWSSIKRSNLVVCSQILHRFHNIPKFYEPPIFLIPLHVATQIYLMCQKLAVDEIGCPLPDHEIMEIPKITEAFKKVFEKFQ